VNGEFLCIKGRYGFDFYDHPERLQAPLARVNGKLEEVSWARRWKWWPGSSAIRWRRRLFRVIGSNHTTNEENYYLQKIRPPGAQDQQHRSPSHGDVAGLLSKLAGESACPQFLAARKAGWPR